MVQDQLERIAAPSGEGMACNNVILLPPSEATLPGDKNADLRTTARRNDPVQIVQGLCLVAQDEAVADVGEPHV
jgi:hypothetical protein